MSTLPDELWKKILEIGVETRGFTHMELCSLSVTSCDLYRLSEDDHLWCHLLSTDFPDKSTHLPAESSKAANRSWFVLEKLKSLIAKKREAQQHSKNVEEFENLLKEKSQKLWSMLTEISRWQPEAVRAKHPQIVNNSVLLVEPRIDALEVELLQHKPNHTIASVKQKKNTNLISYWRVTIFIVILISSSSKSPTLHSFLLVFGLLPLLPEMELSQLKTHAKNYSQRF
ncbi:hypothetical protein UlMin_006980 [Ulmus minor]